MSCYQVCTSKILIQSYWFKMMCFIPWGVDLNELACVGRRGMLKKMAMQRWAVKMVMPNLRGKTYDSNMRTGIEYRQQKGGGNYSSWVDKIHLKRCQYKDEQGCKRIWWKDENLFKKVFLKYWWMTKLLPLRFGTNIVRAFNLWAIIFY